MLALAGLCWVRPAFTATFTQDFAADPALSGWQTFGNSSLFHWDAANQNLAVTWDSTQPNSYFYHPLGLVLTRHDDFRLEFDLRLTQAASGVEPGKTGPLQIGIGFLNWATVTQPAFGRSTYGGAPDIAEFNYFPWGYYDWFGFIYDAPAATEPAFVSGVHPTHYAPTVVSDYNNELPTNQTVHVAMVFSSAQQTLALTLTTNGVFWRSLPILTLDAAHGFEGDDDFHVDTFAISSYSSAADDYNSLLARGTIDNLRVSVDPQPVGVLRGAGLETGSFQVQFFGRTNWLYTLERSGDFEDWAPVSEAVPGSESGLTLSDSNSPPDHAFYRVRAQKP